MKRMGRKMLAMLLCAVLLIGLLPSAALAEDEAVPLCSVAKGDSVIFAPKSGKLEDQNLIIGGTVGSQMKQVLNSTTNTYLLYKVTASTVYRYTYKSGKKTEIETYKDVFSITNAGNTYICASVRFNNNQISDDYDNEGAEYYQNSTGWIQTTMGKALYATEAGEVGFTFKLSGNHGSVDHTGEQNESSVRFSPEGGTFTEPQTVTLSCPAGWSILYTTDGSEPRYDAEMRELIGQQYSGPITVTKNTIIKAAVFHLSDLSIGAYIVVDAFGDIVEQGYFIGEAGSVTVGDINFSPAGGTFAKSQTVTLSCANGWSILYTTDGSNPGLDSFAGQLIGNQYTSPITVDNTTTIKAVTYKAKINEFGYPDPYFLGYTVSDIVEQTYTISQPVLSVNAPTFDPSSGTYTMAQQVAISCETEDAVIHYTTDGTEPTPESPVYTGLITISEDTTLRAVAMKEGLADSLVVTEEYVIHAPGFDLPGSGTEADPWQIMSGMYLNVMPEGWYEVKDSTTLSERIAVSGNVNLVLGAGTTLTALQGINVSSGNSLTISGSGTLNAVGCEGCAGIGGGIDESCGTVTITSGTIIAIGGSGAQAIGVSNEVAANDSGTLTLGSGLMVKAGGSESTAVIASGDLVAACRSAWAMISSSLPFGTPDFTLPAALNVIEESAFEGLTAMTVVDASHCSTVGKWAFKGCTGLTELKLPKNCTIAPDAFTGCGTVYIFAPAGGSTEAYCNAHENCVFVGE